MGIKITGISLDGHCIRVPNGLSELLNASGAWGIRKKTSVLEQYNRKVEKRGEELVTILTLKEAK